MFKLSKKGVIWTIVILLALGLIGFALFGRGKSNGTIQTAVVTRQDIQATVLTTGQVTSRVNLNLGFQASGVVKSVNIAEGAVVRAGQVLAVLDQGAALATLTSARGALAQAEANYEKVLQGSSDQQIVVAQKSVDAAQVSLLNARDNYVVVKAQQDTAVQNASRALFNTAFTAVPGTVNTDGVTATVSGTYTGTQEGAYAISLYSTGGGTRFSVSGLEEAQGFVNLQPVPLGARGLYIQFSGTPNSNDTWIITVPNTSNSSYTVNENAYQSALRARDTQVAVAQAQVNLAQVSLLQAQANLAQVQVQATSAEINSAKAQILSAEGQVESAQVILNNTMLKAPTNGTVTQIDIKVGEQASALKEAMILQDISALHAEAEVSEANIASVQNGQSVDYTFDALGPDRHFTGAVSSVNPASTVVSGVVDYKVIAGIDNALEIKPGMTANMTILVAKKSAVLAVPSNAVISQNGSSFVRVVDDVKQGTYHQVPVTTGLQADGGLVEILSGLEEGQTIVTFLQP